MNRDVARAAIVDLELPAIVLEIFDGQKPERLLETCCQDPYYSFRDNSGLPPTFVPFWESSTLVTGFDSDDKVFKSIDLELPAHPTSFGVSFSYVAADLLIFLAELEYDDVELSRVAEALEYPHLGLVLAAMREATDEDVEPFDDWRRHLLSLGDESS